MKYGYLCVCEYVCMKYGYLCVCEYVCMKYGYLCVCEYVCMKYGYLCVCEYVCMKCLAGGNCRVDSWVKRVLSVRCCWLPILSGHQDSLEGPSLYVVLLYGNISSFSSDCVWVRVL